MLRMLPVPVPSTTPRTRPSSAACSSLRRRLRRTRRLSVRPTRSTTYAEIISFSILTFGVSFRLRQTDVKAGHYERKVQALETERDSWEAKYEEMSKKFNDLQKELHELEVSISNV
jgi:peptidoglycan hydrolase CwlO-like protein